MERDHDFRGQKPLRPTHWSLLLGISQTGMDLYSKKKNSSSINNVYCWQAYWKLIKKVKELGLKMDW